MPALLPALLPPAIIATASHDASALLPVEAPWTLAVDSYYLCHRYRYAGSGIPPARAPDPHEFQADKFLLVAPLWSEDGYYRVVIGAYRVGELPLPAGARVHRVLVPDRVGIVEGDNPASRRARDPEYGILSAPEHLRKPVPEGPWREVKYSVMKRDGLVLVRPERVEGGVFAVEAGLPARDGWVRIALTPGSWLVLFGWSKDFNVLTTEGKVLLHGRAPYDTVRFQLDDVRLVIWYCGYMLDLERHAWFKEVASPINDSFSLYALPDDLPLDFEPRRQYELGVLYGPGIIMRVTTDRPILLEFKAPRPGARVEYGRGGFYSKKYWAKSLSSLEIAISRILYGLICPITPTALLAILLPPLLAAQRARSARTSTSGSTTGHSSRTRTPPTARSSHPHHSFTRRARRPHTR